MLFGKVGIRAQPSFMNTIRMPKCRVFVRTPLRSNSTSTHLQMNWVDFFKLRRQNKVLNTSASILTAGLSGFATLEYLGNVEIDLEKPIFGIDAVIVMGGLVLLGGAAGYLLGPVLGTAVFNLSRRSVLPQFKAKEELFLRRIKRYRVDPSSQSFSNPVPDYYGERIYSLKTYRQWLRDCNAYRRKAQEFI